MCLGKRRDGLSIEMVLVLTKRQELPLAEKMTIIKGEGTPQEKQQHNPKLP